MNPSFQNRFNYLYLVLTYFILGFCYHNIYGQTGWQTGFVLYLKMDGNLTDNGPSGIGFTNNGASLTTDRFGVANKAYSFSNSSQHISMASRTFSHGSVYTYSMWIKKNTQTGVSVPISFNYQDNLNPRNLRYLIFRDGGLKWGGDAVTDPYESGNSILESSLISAWSHIVVTDDGTSVRFYLNGNKVETTAFLGSSPPSGMVKVVLGNYLWDGVPSILFSGSIDEVRVYNKVLTDLDVTGLYNNEKPSTATCSDGIQNQGETGIDCGGPCAACGPGGSSQWTGTTSGIYYNSHVHIGKGNLNTGTDPGYSLFVRNGIKTEKIKVEVPTTSGATGWADHVFYPDYKQMPIRDLEKFIKTNKHLPGFPSLKTILKDGGYEITDMIKRQQESIENLHLYIIELEKNLSEMKSVKNKNVELEARLVKLENLIRKN